MNHAAAANAQIRRLIVICAVIRIAFILLVSGSATSNDVRGWEAVAAALSRGENPYQTTTFLNWPPLWVNLIYLQDLLARAIDVPFFRVNQGFLIGADCLLVSLAFAALRRETDERSAYRIVLFGLCLNPIPVLLTCVGGNFDVLVAIAVVCFLANLLSYLRTSDRSDWLWASFCLGFGVLAKTVPVVLTPLLAVGAKRLTPRNLLFGAALVFAPAAVGVAALYFMAPAEVNDRVIAYRSVPGWFGVSGILMSTGQIWAAKRLYPAIFTLGVLAAVLWSAQRAARSEPMLGEREAIWITALLMAILPGLGSGYGPHYSYWVLPALLFLYPRVEVRDQRFIMVWWAIAAVTIVVQYALAPGLGAFARNFQVFIPLVEWWGSSVDRWASTLITMPLFACYLIFYGVSIRAIRRN